MPVYEYQCKQCQREFEYEQRMSDPDKTVCENCGGALERLISRTAFHLKGGGWYKDLYSSAKPDKPAETKAGDSSTAAATPAPSTSAPASAPASGSASGSTGSSSSGSSSGGSSSGGSSSGSSSSGTGAS